MASLCVGMRVRIVSEVPWWGLGDHPSGKEGRIVAKDVKGEMTGQHYDWGVLCLDGQNVACSTSDLEPIVPDGAKPSAWSDCLWQPEVTV